MDSRHSDHGLYYERHGRIRRPHVEELGDGSIAHDPLYEPDWGALKVNTQALKDLTIAMVDEGPDGHRPWTSKHLRQLDDMETRALEIAAYCAAVRAANSSRTR